MKNLIVFFQFLGFIFVSVSGVLLHFAFDWSGGSFLIAPFSAVNESIWEHMKLIYISLLVYAFFENKIAKNRLENFWCTKALGITLGIFLIPAFYYTYTYGLGITADWVNIATYFVVAAIVFIVETFLPIKCDCSPCSQVLPLFLLVLILISFSIFTFFPPELPIFKDPVTGTYGFFEKV